MRFNFFDRSSYFLCVFRDLSFAAERRKNTLKISSHDDADSADEGSSKGHRCCRTVSRYKKPVASLATRLSRAVAACKKTDVRGQVRGSQETARTDGRARRFVEDESVQEREFAESAHRRRHRFHPLDVRARVRSHSRYVRTTRRHLLPSRHHGR